MINDKYLNALVIGAFKRGVLLSVFGELTVTV